MRVTILVDEKLIKNFYSVEDVFIIHPSLTQVDELKNAILIIHKENYAEKFRLFKNATLLQIEED